jgi:hypothetical protein
MTHSCFKLGYIHEIKSFEYVPEQLKIKPGEGFSSHLKAGQPLVGEDLKFLNKIKGIFDQRRYSVAHIFLHPDKWHVFYFDFHDIEDRTENHWKGGSHVHFVNYLWANLKVEQVWESLAGRSNKSYGIHVRWMDEREQESIPQDGSSTQGT